MPSATDKRFSANQFLFWSFWAFQLILVTHLDKFTMYKEMPSAANQNNSFFHASIAYAVHTYNYWGKIQGKSNQPCLLKDVICNTLTTFLLKFSVI